MKITIRAIGFSFIGVCICLMLMHIFDLNVRLDELNKISELATANTQIVMAENIEDYYYGTDNKRLKIESSEQYLDLYRQNLEILKTSDGEYEIDGYFDPLKGLLCVDITYRYNNFLGKEKCLNKRLINIIDVVINDEEVS